MHRVKFLKLFNLDAFLHKKKNSFNAAGTYEYGTRILRYNFICINLYFLD